MPMLFMRGKTDNITWPNLDIFPTPNPYSTATGKNNEDLTHRMSVPSRPGAWLEGHLTSLNSRGLDRFEKRIAPRGSSEVIIGTGERRTGPIP